MLGGLLIGLAAVVLFLSIGRIAVLGGIFFSALKNGGAWRWLILVGIAVGAGFVGWFLPAVRGVTRPDPGIGWVMVAGLLVGWGTRLGSGCTSGHGVCGLGLGNGEAPIFLVAVVAGGLLQSWWARCHERRG